MLAVISTHLPSALRTFPLTLAVVDDLLAITVIAVFYTDKIKVIPLVAALIPLLIFATGAEADPVLVAADPAGGVLTWPSCTSPGCTPPPWQGAAGLHGAGAARRATAVTLAESAKRLGLGRMPGPAGRALRAPDAPHPAGWRVPVFAFFAAGVDPGRL